MTDETVVPGQQTSDQQTQAPASPTVGAVDWEARYKGVVKKIEDLTIANRTLNDQLAQKSSEMEQLRVELTVKDTEKASAVSERDARLNQLITQEAATKQELEQLRSLQLKVKTAQDLGRPDLMLILETIPAISDPEALKNIMSQLGEWADGRVQEREKQLMAGVTSVVGAPSAAKAAPSSPQQWIKHIESLGLGTPERAKALDDYGDWLEQTHKQP